VKRFNKAWESERISIESQLVTQLNNEIEYLKTSSIQPGTDPEYAKELEKLRVQLIFRKSMARFESEEIARQRMQLRASYLAVVISSVALLTAVITAVAK
jgi:RecA/RadA recombinase